MEETNQQQQSIQQQQSPGDVFKNNLESGVIIGGAAYIIGYITTYVFITMDGVEFPNSEIPLWKFVGHVFYSAQQVTVETTTSDSGMQTETIRIFGEIPDIASTVPEILYKIAPVVILIGAGYYAYQQVQGPSLSTEAAAALGASIISGYAVMAVIGKFIFTFESGGLSGGYTIEPVLMGSVLFIGLIYPIFFGGIGGVLANR